MEQDELMTDSDAEQDRIARFSKLPPRVRPEEMVELAETRDSRGRPASALSEDEQTLRYAAG